MAASMRRLFAQKSNCLGLKSLLDDLSSTPAYNYVPVLFNTNSSKHYDLKWRVKRREKTAYKMSHLTALRTIRWQYNEALERPKVTLAIYDQFGRIMYGNENHPTNVLEFIVFEKNISDLYGRWKVHDKVVPKWLTLKQELHNSKRITDDEARAFEDIMEEEAQKQKEEEKAKKKAEKKAEKEAEKIRNLKKMRTV
ncbi:RM45-like protein [Mya arenaria]|uniref:RM45-like protein n=1 Tax=Mya arenaria TaxID=6604 RepID=A0ABY7E8Q3_MYAAR|nr:RM45-like protein [Mya arenaria]